MRKLWLFLLPLLLVSCETKESTSSPSASESPSASKTEESPSESETPVESTPSSSPTGEESSSSTIEEKADLSITREDIPPTSQSSYLLDTDIEVDGVGFHLNYVQQGNGSNAGTIQIHKYDGEIYNTDALGHNRVMIALQDERNQWNPVIAKPIVYAGYEVNPTENSVEPTGDHGGDNEYVWIYDFDSVYPYFRIENSDPDIGRAAYAYSITFTNVG